MKTKSFQMKWCGGCSTILIVPGPVTDFYLRVVYKTVLANPRVWKAMRADAKVRAARFWAWEMAVERAILVPAACHRVYSGFLWSCWFMGY